MNGWNTAPYGYMPPYAPQNAVGAPNAIRGQIMRVNGRRGAEAVRLAENSSVLALDENEPILWVIATDGAGYATPTPFVISPYQPAPEINVNDLESRIKRLEEMLNGESGNADVDTGKRKPSGKSGG